MGARLRAGVPVTTTMARVEGTGGMAVPRSLAVRMAWQPGWAASLCRGVGPHPITGMIITAVITAMVITAPNTNYPIGTEPRRLGTPGLAPGWPERYISVSSSVDQSLLPCLGIDSVIPHRLTAFREGWEI